MSLERVWSEFGESLENLQTHSKLTKKSLLDVIFQFVLKKRGKKMSLENLQTLSKKKYACTTLKKSVQPLKKELCTHIFLSLERVWRFSKLIFPFFCLNFFLKNDIKQRFLCEFGASLE